MTAVGIYSVKTFKGNVKKTEIIKYDVQLCVGACGELIGVMDAPNQKDAVANVTVYDLKKNHHYSRPEQIIYNIAIPFVKNKL